MPVGKRWNRLVPRVRIGAFDYLIHARGSTGITWYALVGDTRIFYHRAPDIQVVAKNIQ